MTRQTVHRALAVLAGIGLLAVPAGPAQATINDVEVVLTGSGTISPGLTATPTTQSWAFSGTAVTTGTIRKGATVLAQSSCLASGDSYVRDIFFTNAVMTKVQETVAYGAGSGTWSCPTGVLAGKGGKLAYEREGATIEVILTDGGKPPSGIGDLKCLFVPHQATPPVTSFDLVCEGEYTDVK